MTQPSGEEVDRGHRCFEPEVPRRNFSAGTGYLTTPMNQPCDIGWHINLVTVEEYERLRDVLAEVVRFFFVENAEWVSGGRTYKGEFKVWVNGEKGYLSTAAADAIEAILIGRGPASDSELSK